ncbi:hypothetical protein G3N95_30070 [Paraburkholderia sp. Tr-20389]|uniref:hypothetical protein n=1 Tax=Paraburkholderia sp. Tr-20389 TaxID=2703903 RepID=UPI0019812AD8|nr:hypothetical protein [Paraburkholderia sp. Tr-20389]MBN3757222.1 hypothetical protein [Paraburkholderia sp. Tr-20389]
MSFLYPRTISIGRQTPVTGGGVKSYSGMQPAQETPVAAGLPASIQLDKERGKTEANLPADSSKTLWRVFIPLGYAPLGLIQSRDIVTDDLSARYQVLGMYWNSLGHNLLCERLEA